MSYYIAKNGFSGTAGQTVTLPDEMNSLVFVNDSDTVTLMVTLSKDGYSRTFPVGPKGIFDEVVDPYNTIQVVGTGNYYGWPRRRNDEQM